MNEHLARGLVQERTARLEADALRHTRLHDSPDEPVRPVATGAVRQALTIRDMGRLALVSLVVMLFGLGVVGLWTAATEPRPPGPHAGQLP